MTAVLATVLATAGSAVTAPAAAAAPARGCDRAVLDGPAHGAEAVSALAGRLPDAAALLRRDPSAWLDRCGNTFFVEPGTAATTAQEGFLTGATSTIPTDQAFALHSRPGSSRVIFLDVDGHLISNTGWNDSFTGGLDLQAAPYDTDGNPASFSAAERIAVISIWQRVAEDYAAFDVDVTTADPGAAAIDRSGAADTAFGTRALITNSTLNCGGCAGIGYLDVFDATSYHAYTQPALAFSTTVGGSPKLLADIVSHEVGHNFGLEHDATALAPYFNGHGAWTPIMGSATNRPITQWSNGSYEGANNHEDDFAVIAAGGAPRVADDHGDTADAATPYVLGSPASGLIGSAGDTDWFSFTTGGGAATLSATPTAVGADLDLRLDLLDSTGALVASADPASGTTLADPPAGLAATLSLTLPAGTYHVRLDGVGSGDPLVTGYTDYGSVGRYTLAVSAPAPEPPPVDQPAELAVATTALPAATRGRAYTTSLIASGATGTVVWAVTAGALPGGLTLSGDGVLAGTPTAAGTFPFTAQATDPLGRTAVRDLALVVRLPLVVTTSVLPGATRGQRYARQLTGSGGLAPYVWRLRAGTLPPGITLSSAGRLSGTPTTQALYSFTVAVTDAARQTATRTLSLRVNPRPVVRTTSLSSGLKGRWYASRLAAVGGTPALRWRVYAGTLPTGMRFSSTGLLYGTPSVRGTRYVSFQVADARGAISRRTLRIVIR